MAIITEWLTESMTVSLGGRILNLFAELPTPIDKFADTLEIRFNRCGP